MTFTSDKKESEEAWFRRHVLATHSFLSYVIIRRGKKAEIMVVHRDKKRTLFHTNKWVTTHSKSEQLR